MWTISDGFDYLRLLLLTGSEHIKALIDLANYAQHRFELFEYRFDITPENNASEQEERNKLTDYDELPGNRTWSVSTEILPYHVNMQET